MRQTTSVFRSILIVPVFFLSIFILFDITQTTVEANDEPFIAVAAGFETSVGLQSDGTIVAVVRDKDM